MIERALRLLRDECGASMTEYALLLSLLSGAAMAVLIAISRSGNTALVNDASSMQSFQMGPPP